MDPGDSPPQNRYYNPSRRRNTDAPQQSPPSTTDGADYVSAYGTQYTPPDETQRPIYADGASSSQAPQSTPGRLRALTDIPGNILRGRTPPWNTTLPSGDGGPSYSPLRTRDGEGSPTHPATTTGNMHLTIPTLQVPQGDGGNRSPVSPDDLDVAGFQHAVSGFGMEFGPPLHGQDGSRAGPSHFRQDSSPSIISQQSDAPTTRNTGDARLMDIPLIETDTAPMTSNAAPIAGALNVPEASPRTSNAGPQRPRITTTMLGDDLVSQMENGNLSPSRSGSGRRSGSPSTASTLQRGASMLRQMSQRIVNMSNEQDVVERSLLRRNASVPEREPSPNRKIGDGEEMEMEMRPLPSKLPSPGVVTPATTPGLERDELSPDYLSVYPSGRRPSYSADDDSAAQASEPLQRRPSPIRGGRWRTNPFKGYSLGIFSPDSRLRMKLCDFLIWTWTENIILGLIIFQTVILAIDSNRDIAYDDIDSVRFGRTWIDYVLLGLFIIYTVEIVAKIIVSGLILNDAEYSTVDRRLGWRRAVFEKIKGSFGEAHQLNNVHNPSEEKDLVDEEELDDDLPPLIYSLTTHHENIDGDSFVSQRMRLARRAFLRHSFNRLDFISVIAFWISFVLQLFSIESGRHAFVFRMLSCLRIMRLLRLTSGTSVILRSLKKAAPLLLNVGFLIGFFWLIFAIIGVQSFKSSLRRQCVWVDPTNSSNKWTNSFQFCGGFLDPITSDPQPWLQADGTPGATTHKGYLCPVQSVCQESTNPYNGSVSYDNVLESAQLVFVLMTTNTFTDLMYYVTNSDYLAAALFSAIGVVILYFWLVNLLIAVITSTFQVIREGSKSSPFTGEREAHVEEEPEDSNPLAKRRRKRFKDLFQKTKWLWLAAILYGLVVMCLRSASMGHARAEFIDISEKAVTFMLLIEIMLRAGVYAIDRRNFFRSKANVVDLIIAIITAIMQIPHIHDSGEPYAWLTFFQIIRIYRLVMAVPMTRNLILTVLGNVTGLINLIIFVFLINFLAAILATQLFRGSLPQVDSNNNPVRVQFFSLWNSFLGMYQVFSSENWTVILYDLTNYNMYYNTAWIASIFFIIWFILANFITVNMFIAIIQENFDISEDKKRLKQIENFIEQRELGLAAGHGNMSLANIIRQGVAGMTGRRDIVVGSGATDLLLKDAVVTEFLHQYDGPDQDEPGNIHPDRASIRLDPDGVPQVVKPAPSALVRSGTLSSVWTTIVSRFKDREPNPFYSRINISRLNDEEGAAAIARTTNLLKTQKNREQSQRDYLNKHKKYNVSLYIFPYDNPIRRWCQMIVGPGHGGKRIEGIAPKAVLWYPFSAVLFACVVAMVLIACITTPLYQKEYFEKHNTRLTLRNWLTFSDAGFAVVFTIEAIIKVIADGFFWAPHAYYRSTWGFIDGIVLVTLWISVIGAFINDADISRSVGALKALRALRLLNISDRARENFHAVIVRGAPKIIGAAFVSMSLLVPFAIFGVNLFADKMYSCNDGNSNIDHLEDCWGEYGTNSPYNWNVYSPRVAANPYYSFDNFGASLSILFQIVSQEGWIDVMFSAQSIVGPFRQSLPFASQGNAVFFVIFNLLGSVFVLTLFVSVFMRNYTEMTGVAFLTTEQRSWLELRKRLYQISPSKRKKNLDEQPEWKQTVYRMAVTKSGRQGRWHQFITTVLILHLIMLCTEFDPSPTWWDDTRDAVFLFFTFIFAVNIGVRLVGLGWPRFQKSSWDLFSLVAVTGTMVSTIMVLAQQSNVVFAQIQRLFLVLIAFLLIPRNNQLDQLFKTAAASLPLITNLMATWFVLFLIFAIAMTQEFSLTRFGAQGTGNLNLRNVPKALILLFRMSVGEGWNQIMEDYSIAVEPFCTAGNGDALMSDCGSAAWARSLFITWNILSMYLFVNLFISLIYESFSYVYQVSSGLRIITREEIRRYKEAWAEVDPNGTGSIQKDAVTLSRVLRELGGVFDMRIYPEEFSVSRLKEECALQIQKPGTIGGNRPASSSWSIGGVDEPFRAKVKDIDLKSLNARLAAMPVAEIRKRRNRLNLFWQEVMSGPDRERIGFTDLLLALTHYKVINDNKSLQLPEWLRRKQRLVLIEQEVRRQIVKRFIEAYKPRKAFKRHQERNRAGRIATVGVPRFEFAVPEIFVEDEDVQRLEEEQRQRDRAVRLQDDNPFSDASGGMSGVPTPSGTSSPRSDNMSRRNSIQISPMVSPQFGPTRGRSPPHLTPHLAPAGGSVGYSPTAERGHRPSFDAVPPLDLSGDQAGAARGRANSAVSVQDVLEQLENSAWGASLRRSISQTRRSPSRNGGSRERPDTAPRDGPAGS